MTLTARSLAAACGLSLALAGAARAQDSVATNPGLPGDALDAYKVSPVSEQVNNYAVDLATITSSWGNRFAIGPALKSSKANSAGLFNHFIGAQAASNRFIRSPYLRTSYLAWAAAGQGVNDTANSTPTDNGSGLYGTLNTTGQHGTRFALSMMEFGGGVDVIYGSGDDENNIITGVIEFPLRRPNRLFVSRITALTNKATNVAGNSATASLGLGGVDNAGQTHLLGDGFGLFATGRLSNKSLVRVAAASRNAAVVNRLQQSGAGDAPATSTVLETATTLSTPSIIPTHVAGRPVLISADFASNLIYESAPLATSTTKDYLPAATGSSRGNIAFTASPFPPLATGQDNAGTAAMLARTDGGTRTRAISCFVLDTDGSVDGQNQITLPSTAGGIVDPQDGYDPSVHFAPLADHEFTSYQGQVPFRGGNGQLALATMLDGDLLIAGLVTMPTGGQGTGASLPQGQDNYIAVARIQNQTGLPVSWTIAAHTGTAAGAAGGLSKAILGDFGADGIPGTSDAGEGDGIVDATPIGRIARHVEAYTDRNHGPSISSPMMDARGNLYFTATVRLNATGQPLFTTALLRANYAQPTSPTGAGSYQLELIAKQGDVIRGVNSATDYQLQFLPLADGDSADSGAPWSGNIVQDSIAGAAAGGASAPFGSPMSLGVLGLRARIIYDVNDDGQYVDPATTNNTGPDQAYHAVMALMPAIRPGDVDRSGVVGSADITTFLSRWFADLQNGTFTADWDGNNVVSSADITAMLADWFMSIGG